MFKTAKVCAAISVATFAFGCSRAEMSASKGNPTAEFLVDSSHSSHSEIAASEIAVQRASDPRVKQFAQMMIHDHNQQDQSLAQLASAKQLPVPERPDEAHVKAAENLRHLPASDFDRAYISEVVADHAKLLSKLEDKAATSNDPDVRSWAQTQVPVIRMHLEQARQLDKALGGASDVGSNAAH